MDEEIRQIPSGTFAENTLHTLHDLFKAWELPEKFVSGISKRWKCQVVRLAQSDDEIRTCTLHGVPVLLDSRHAQKVFEEVGHDSLDYLIENPERNKFPRHKIAFVAGANLLAH